MMRASASYSSLFRRSICASSNSFLSAEISASDLHQQKLQTNNYLRYLYASNFFLPLLVQTLVILRFCDLAAVYVQNLLRGQS
jgi:hypothetical protein